MSLPELQQNLRIPQPSCYRIVQTFVQRRWLEKHPDGGYDIAGALTKAAEKKAFHLEKYRKFQPVMNALVKSAVFSVKLSIRTGDEFVNTCAARDPESLLTFSEPGCRYPLRIPATVSVIFLAEDSPEMQKKTVEKDQFVQFRKYLAEYRKNGFSFIEGATGQVPLDTLSFPIKKDASLLGVVSFLGPAGSMERLKLRIRNAARPFFSILAEELHA